MVVDTSVMSYEKECPKTHYVGVSWNSQRQMWRATIRHEKKQYWIGYFVDDKKAAIAVNKTCIEIGAQLRNPELSDVGDKSQQVNPLHAEL